AGRGARAPRSAGSPRSPGSGRRRPSGPRPRAPASPETPPAGAPRAVPSPRPHASHAGEGHERPNKWRMPQADGPFRNFNFRAEIEGVAAADFSEVDGLVSETEVIEYRTGSMPGTGSLKLPGRTRFSNLVLRRGLTRDAELWNWWRAIVEGQPDRRTVSVVLQ